jgi:hypothetical protein
MKFILKTDVQNGVIPNSNGKPNILFKKGDVVHGDITTRYFLNKPTQGIEVLPTVQGGLIETEKYFLDLVFLEQVSESFIELNWKWLLGAFVIIVGFYLTLGKKNTIIKSITKSLTN